MKKYIFLFLFCFMFGQGACADSAAERRALSVPHTIERDMKRLVDHLTHGERDKYEQAKAIAVWIASHVAYDNYTFAAQAGKASGHKASNRLQAGAQTADKVFDSKIATCAGYADLYEKMLNMAGISSQKVHGFAIYNASSAVDAKRKIRGESIGHVWNEIHLPRKDILVDLTGMSSGRVGDSSNRLTPTMQKAELRQINREKPTYAYTLKYFDFSYKDLQNAGDYRFDKHRKLFQR